MDNINVGLPYSVFDDDLLPVDSERTQNVYKKKSATAENVTLETGRAKWHVLCTGRALSVHVSAPFPLLFSSPSFSPHPMAERDDPQATQPLHLPLS